MARGACAKPAVAIKTEAKKAMRTRKIEDIEIPG
jgi:hypothetical protein